MNIEARLRALEEKLKPTDAIIVQMPNGAIVSIQPRAGEKILDCIQRLIENPLSEESRDLAHAVEYLRPDGHVLEVIAPMIGYYRDILVGKIDVNKGLEPGDDSLRLEPWQACGLSAPPSEQELARLRQEEAKHASELARPQLIGCGGDAELVRPFHRLRASGQDLTATRVGLLAQPL